MPESRAILDIDEVDVCYGNVKIVQNVTLSIAEGEIVTLIGANGAGKTTLMMAISGIVACRSGRITFAGTRIERLKPHHIVRLGLIQVAQGRHLFPDLSVDHNLELGAWRWAHDEETRRRLAEVYEYFPSLRERAHQRAGSLSGGEQQMLAFGRALMSRPKLLLLDELSASLAPFIVKELAKIVRALRDTRGLTTLLVEQNAYLALELADRGYVLETGRIVASGRTAELAESDLVRRAYLGYRTSNKRYEAGPRT